MMEPRDKGGEAGRRPSVSVCIPTYNAGKTVEKCLESVMGQTVRPSEVMIVDGYSQDDTLEVVKRFPAVRVVGFAKGIGRARRMLADEARGDIVAWVDADVMVPSNWLETHLKIHERDKEIMTLSGNWGKIPKLAPGQNPMEVSCEVTPVYECSGVGTQLACTMKRELFSIVNYDERFRRGEEWDLMVSAVRKGIRAHCCDGLFFFHSGRPKKLFLKDMVYRGNYVIFLKKYGFWYIKFNPSHFLAFIMRIALIYAIPLSFLCPFALLVYPAAWAARCLYWKTLENPFWLLVEYMKGIGEHLYLLKVL